MFEQLFKSMQLSAIGAKVVDSTKDFTIPVYVPPPPPPPPPEEGKAFITSVDSPSNFTPNVSFNITVYLRNYGGEDWIFVRLINKDTGNLIKEARKLVTDAGSWIWNISLALPQNTDFHGKIEAGHET